MEFIRGEALRPPAQRRRPARLPRHLAARRGAARPFADLGLGGSLAPPARIDESRIDDEPIVWVFAAHREQRLGGVDLSPEHYRGQLRPRLLRSTDPAASEIIKALDARF